MSNNNSNAQPVQIDNPVLVDRIEATKTKGGSPQLSLYSGALEYPVLNFGPVRLWLAFWRRHRPERDQRR
jgi:hypothetical protein